MRSPFWRWKKSRAEVWHRLGFSDYVYRTVRFGNYEKPNVPLIQGEGVVLPLIPQSDGDRAFELADL